jgi:hypothetical protein
MPTGEAASTASWLRRTPTAGTRSLCDRDEAKVRLDVVD